MAHSIPRDGIADVADAERLAYAIEGLVQAMLNDERVRRTCDAWREHIGASDAFLSLLRRGYGHPDPSVDDLRRFCELGAALDHAAGGQLALVRVLCESIGISYLWLPSILLAHFKVMCLDAATGTPHTIAVKPPADIDLSPGKRAWYQGRDVQRNARWYYRTQFSGEKKAAIAREERIMRSAVQNGVKQAEVLLSQVVNLPQK